MVTLISRPGSPWVKGLAESQRCAVGKEGGPQGPYMDSGRIGVLGSSSAFDDLCLQLSVNVKIL